MCVNKLVSSGICKDYVVTHRQTDRQTDRHTHTHKPTTITLRLRARVNYNIPVVHCMSPCSHNNLHDQLNYNFNIPCICTNE